MAEKIVNNGIVFAYASNDAFFEIKKQLEKYFLYQTILVVDENYEYGKQIDDLKQNINCNFVVCHNIKQVDFFQNIDFVVAINDKSIFEIKQKCFENKIPYMVVLTKVASFSVCTDHVFDRDQKQVLTNKPFGIVLDKSQIFEKKKFICKAILEISMSNFEITQKNINNLFYGKKIDYDLMLDEKKSLDNLVLLFDKKNYDTKLLFDEICDIYVTYLIKKSSDDISLLEILTFLYLKYDKQIHDRFIETKYLYMQTLCLLQTKFFAKYQSGYKDAINYQIHQKKLAFYGKNSDFLIKNLPDSKINFLLEQFQNKFIEYTKQQNLFNEKIKNFVADTDIDFLFDLYNNVDKDIFVDMLSLEPTIYKEQNFLSLMFCLGLLNYSI